MFGLTAVEQKLRIRHERRAEPARGHIAHAEIAHDRAAEALGKHCFLAELERACEGAREVFFFFRNVPERLAVAADEIDVGELRAGLRAERLARLAEKLASAASTPSADVPDMNPITSRDGFSHSVFRGCSILVKPPVFLTYCEKFTSCPPLCKGVFL